MLRDYRKQGLGETARTLLAELSSRGLRGSTILELGCGFGALTLALLKEGASSAIGVDLSPKMIEAARLLAAEAGLSASVSFECDDGARAKLAPADIVILDTVLCCYPDLSTLLANSSSATKRYYAISIPDDRRPLARLLKVFLPLQTVFFRKGGFRFHIHSTEAILRSLADNGFKVVSDSAAGWVWSVLVFASPAETLRASGLGATPSSFPHAGGGTA